MISKLLLVVGTVLLTGSPAYAIYKWRSIKSPQNFMELIRKEDYVDYAFAAGAFSLISGIVWNIFGFGISALFAMAGTASIIIGGGAALAKREHEKSKSPILWTKGNAPRTIIELLTHEYLHMMGIGAISYTLALIWHIFNEWAFFFSLMGCAGIYGIIAFSVYKKNVSLREVIHYDITTTMTMTFGAFFILAASISLLGRGTITMLFALLGLIVCFVSFFGLIFFYVGQFTKEEENTRVNVQFFRLFRVNKYLMATNAVALAVIFICFILG